MKNEQVLELIPEGSALMSQFLGWQKTEKGNFMIPNLFPMEMDGHGETEWETNNMSFHDRWDWLIPVANKIQKLYRTNFGIIQTELRNDSSFIARMAVKKMFEMSDVSGQLEINSVFLKCYDFLKWYESVGGINSNTVIFKH
jgi:hypothetical protein